MENFQSYMLRSGKMKVIIDTDGGVDDAMALLMAVASTELQILAITTTAGNTDLEQVNANVHRTLDVASITVILHIYIEFRLHAQCCVNVNIDNFSTV